MIYSLLLTTLFFNHLEELSLQGEHEKVCELAETLPLDGIITQKIRIANAELKKYEEVMSVVQKELSSGNRIQALDCFSKVFDLNLPDKTIDKLLFEFGTLCFREAQFERGKDAFKKLILRGEKEKGWTAIARGYLRLGRRDSDLESTILALKEIDSELTPLLEALATDDFREKDTLYLNFPIYRSQNLINWGLSLIQRGFLEQGEAHLETAYNLNALDDDSLDFLALMLRKDRVQKQPHFQALQAFQKVPSLENAEKLQKDVPENVRFFTARRLFEEGYSDIAKTFLTVDSPEALFLRAQIEPERKAILKTLIEKYPAHPLADTADFMLYTLQEYLSGGREEVNHLQKHVNRKTSPYLGLAYYLIGLDFKKDRKSEDGRWIRRQNLNAAIDAFSKALDDPESKEMAALELGGCNYEIAKHAKGTKRELYLEYAKEVLAKIDTPSGKLMFSEVLIALNDLETAEKVLRELEASQVFPAKSLFLLAEVFLKNKHYEKALVSLNSAKKEIHEFSEDERLQLLMSLGICLKALGRLDEAMSAYSAVVNADIVSSKRVEACFERAYIYKEQNRLDLYRKQLEAIIKIGGPWKLKAEKLLETHHD